MLIAQYPQCRRAAVDRLHLPGLAASHPSWRNAHARLNLENRKIITFAVLNRKAPDSQPDRCWCNSRRRKHIFGNTENKQKAHPPASWVDGSFTLLTNTALLANTTAAPELSAPLPIPPAPRRPPPGAVVIASLLEQFKSIPAPRDQPRVDHPLLDVLLCALFAMISDGADYTDIRHPARVWNQPRRRPCRACGRARARCS